MAETLADKKPDSKNANASGPETAVVVEPAEDDPAKDAENQEEADPAPAHLWERHEVADSGPGGGGDAEEELALGNVPVEIIGEIPEELRNIEVQVESEPLDIEPVTVSFVGVLPGELIPEDGDSVPSTPGLLAGIPENADDVSVVDLSQISQDTPGDGLVTDVGGVVLETSAQDDDSGGLFQQLFGSIGSLFDPVTEYFGLGATGPSDPLVDDGIAGGNPGGATGPSSGVAPMEPTEQLTGDPDTAPVSQTSELDANQDAQTAESAAQSPDKVGLDQVAESTLPTADAGGAGATPDLPPDRVPPTPAAPQSLGGLLAQERALAGDIEAASSTIEAIQSGALDIDAMSAEQRTALLGSLERIAPLMDAIDPARLQAREQELAAISDDMRQTDDMIRKFGEDASRDGTIANIWAAIYTVGNAVGGTLAAVELSNIPVVSQQAKLLSATMGLSEGAVGVAGTLGPIASAGVRSNAQSGPGLGVPTGRPGASGSGPGNTTGHPLPEAANRQVDRFNKTLELIGSADTFDDAMKHVYGFENQWKAELTQLENLKTAVDTGRSLSSFRSSTQGALDATNDGETSVAVQKGLLASAAAMKFADATVETSRWAAELGGSERFAQQFSGLGNRMGWAGSGAELAERAGNVIEGANMFLDGRAEQVRLDQVNASMHRQSGQAINRVAELQQVSRRLQQYHGKFTNPDTRQLIERLRNSP